MTSGARTHTGPRITHVLLGLYGVMWIGGIGAYLWRGGVAPHEQWTAPVFLLLAGVIVLVSAPQGARTALAAAAALGLAAEWVGVRYSWLFGVYTYTERLFPSLFGVPIVMASAWLVLVAYVRTRIARVTNAPGPSVLLSALWLTAIDLVLDPVASGPLAYWTWTLGGSYYGVPWQNFVGWFLVGTLVFAVVMVLDRRSAGAAVPPHVAVPNGPGRAYAHLVGLSIVLFFTILAAAFGLIVPASIGLLLCARDLAVARRTSAVGAIGLQQQPRALG